MTGTPPARRRLLGAVLRRYRENLGYDLADAARVLDCDRSKISRIETGHRGISRRDLRDLLAEYGVAEEASRELEAIGDPRRARGWWQDYSDVLPEALEDYLILEAVAAEVLVYETQQVPGLLQTPGYAQAIAGTDPGVPAGLEARLASAWAARQEQVLAPDGPAVSAVVTEGALRQAVGGTALMRAQLAHLAAISENNARVAVQVLPFAAGAHPGIGTGPAVVLGFAQASGLGVVKLASLSGGILLDWQRDVERYVRAFTELQAVALPPDKSASLLRQLAGG
ncbi:helix-turn-helix transcriptional regulator [Trebonia sp.]|uniref:helix-turn-helix domain-containing protein n=1 Tax=Trebonia sp. TaxID=2767075 RepID=UPI0026087110|nr:helix-turn-helix transcriptional regulator [Trebonia sp.]